MSGPILLALRIMMALLLYAFLGMALYSMWRDTSYQVRLLKARLAPPLNLLHHNQAESIKYRFTTPEVIIGRDPACDCSLDDQTVSAQHTRLSFRQGHWWVEDLHSTNGTFVNQQPVSAPLVIIHGDQLRCGQAVFTVSIEDTYGSGV